MIFVRQTAMFNPNDHQYVQVHIIGLGNIGSHAALTLARMGIKSFILWDPDTIEEHNLSSQTYSAEDIGKTKVLAITEQLKKIDSTIEVEVFESKYSYAHAVGFNVESGIYVIGVDSLEARRDICSQLQDSGALIIDGRIGGEQLEVYTVEPGEWAATIPEHATPEPCGGEYICYVSAMIGAIITCQVKKYLTEQPYPKSILMNMGTYDILKNHAW